MTATKPTDPQEGALQLFLANVAPPVAVRMRTLAHAWAVAGGHLQVGKVSCRLLSGQPGFTAGTLFATQEGHPTLELSRIQIQARGVSDAQWQAWCDERAPLRAHGFSPTAKYATVRLDALDDADMVRLVTGLRDLALQLATPATSTTP